MYFADVERATGRLLNLRMTPMRLRKLRLERASASEAEWLRASVERASARFGSRLDLADGQLSLRVGSGRPDPTRISA
ncbi:MAG: hypothetical protein HY654_03745 [Acidobacteria bacterium]|nr:hypothetical protein [Acidobacteriota bacterium]